MRIRLLLLAVVPLVLIAADKDAGKKEFPKLHGTWKVVAAEKDGKAFDAIKGGTLVIKDQNFAIKTASGTELKGDLALNVGKKPRTMAFAHQEGPLQDKTWHAIYDLDGDTLKICYAELESGKDPPTQFKTEQDSGFLLIILERHKVKK
jgi:uncharacterized protein (TIGR03067 family)